MDRKIKSSSPEAPKPQNSCAEPTVELWEPPFDRWLRLTDDLLRDWPNTSANHPEQRL